MLVKFNHKKYTNPEILFEKADALLANNETLEQAIDMLYDITREYPEFGKAFNHLGWIYENKFQDYEKAEENYKKALELDPLYPATYENYAYVLERLGKLNEMEELLSKAELLTTTNKFAVRNLTGRLKELRRDFDGAIVEYKNAIFLTFNLKIIDDLKNNITRCEEKRFIEEKYREI